MTCCAFEERRAAGANKGFGGGVTTTQVSYPVPAANTSTSSGSVGDEDVVQREWRCEPYEYGQWREMYRLGNDWGYYAYQGGQAMPLVMSAMRMIWGMTRVEDCLNK